jgi:predicted RNase H-like HicB family nuclease
MIIRIGIDKGFEGRVVAYALDFPGCFTYGMDEAEALLKLPQALLKYEIWIKDHTEDCWVNFTEMDLRVTDVMDSFIIDEETHPELFGVEINAFFEDDLRALSSLEVERALLVFTWQREELYGGISTLTQDILEKQYPDQRWNILGILKHVANAENWYLSRLGYSNLRKEQLPEEPLARLEMMQEAVEDAFRQFPLDTQVHNIDGETWSCRKILRRTLWHQRDHIEHIKQLIFRD